MNSITITHSDQLTTLVNSLKLQESAKVVLASLSQYYSPTNCSNINVSIAHLERQTGLVRRTIQRMFKRLIEAGYLKIQSNFKNNKQISNTYFIVIEAILKSVPEAILRAIGVIERSYRNQKDLIKNKPKCFYYEKGKKITVTPEELKALKKSRKIKYCPIKGHVIRIQPTQMYYYDNEKRVSISAEEFFKLKTNKKITFNIVSKKYELRTTNLKREIYNPAARLPFGKTSSDMMSHTKPVSTAEVLSQHTKLLGISTIEPNKLRSITTKVSLKEAISLLR